MRHDVRLTLRHVDNRFCRFLARPTISNLALARQQVGVCRSKRRDQQFLYIGNEPSERPWDCTRSSGSRCRPHLNSILRRVSPSARSLSIQYNSLSVPDIQHAVLQPRLDAFWMGRRLRLGIRIDSNLDHEGEAIYAQLNTVAANWVSHGRSPFRRTQSTTPGSILRLRLFARA